jgi:hypothetical protein
MVMRRTAFPAAGVVDLQLFEFLLNLYQRPDRRCGAGRKILN